MVELKEISNFFSALTHFIEVVRDNVWASIALTLMFVIYIGWMVSKIINIKHSFMADSLDKAESVLYNVEKGSDAKWKPIWRRATDFHSGDNCVDCIHPLGSFNGTLHHSLFDGTLNRIKRVIHKGKVFSMDALEYEKFLQDFGATIRDKSQWDISRNSKGLGVLIERTNDERFPSEAGVEKVREIFDEVRLLKKKETKDIWRTIFFWKWWNK